MENEQQHIDTIKKNRYLEALYSYGFYTLCYMITQYEKEENYEECKLILSALNDHNLYMKDNVPTKFDNNAIEYFRKVCYKQNISGTIYTNNLPFYIEEIKKLVTIIPIK
jgi:hypothetical protein